MTRSGRMFSSADLAFATDLASRVAIAVDNSHLFAGSQRAVRAQQDLLSIVSHDLRSPITAIILSADAMMRVAPSQDRRAGRGNIVRIKRCVTQMRRMVEDLLDLTAVELGQLSIDVHEHTMRSLFEETIDMLAPAAEDQGVELVIDASPELEVRCDRERVLQVLANLVGNALRFTPSGGRVTLSARHEGDSVCVRVRDTGPGIADSILGTLFDRGARPRVSSRKSRGLGLFICRGIIEAHGGRIWAESERGRGATLTFTLDGVVAERRSPTVLIAEDDVALCEKVSQLLVAHGYRVVKTRGSKELLEYLDEAGAAAAPQLVLLDLNLSVTNGRELIHAMKGRAHLAEIPVVLLSNAEWLEDEAARLGAAGAIRKPIDPTNLLAVVDACGGGARAA
jgi:CheY-like chemotaxis protein/two-component sensor histidine kinase